MAQASHSMKSSLILFIFLTLLVLSMFYRVSSAVIAPRLVEDLGLNAKTLGIIGGADERAVHQKILFDISAEG